MNLAAKVARRRDTTIEYFGTHLPPWTFNSGITVTPFLTFKCIPAKAIGLPPPPFRLQRKVVRAALNPPRNSSGIESRFKPDGNPAIRHDLESLIRDGPLIRFGVASEE
jgi:hypothetical protein